MKRKKSHRNIKTKNEVLKREQLGIWLDGMTKQRLPNKSSKDFSIDLNVEDDYGITAWHCKYDRSEIVKLIIESSTKQMAMETQLSRTFCRIINSGFPESVFSTELSRTMGKYQLRFHKNIGSIMSQMYI